MHEGGDVQVQEELHEGEVLHAGEELHAEDPHEGEDKISFTFFILINVFQLVII